MLSDKFGDRKAFEGMMTLAPSDARPNINSFRVWAGISEISVGFMAFEEGRKWDPKEKDPAHKLFFRCRESDHR